MSPAPDRLASSLARDPLAASATVICALLAIAALAAPWLAPSNP